MIVHDRNGGMVMLKAFLTGLCLGALAGLVVTIPLAVFAL